MHTWSPVEQQHKTNSVFVKNVKQNILQSVAACKIISVFFVIGIILKLSNNFHYCDFQ